MNDTTLENEKLAGLIKNLESDIEELEAIVAPGMYRNHNETLITDSEAEEIVLEIEALEAKIAPVGRFPNHNETFLRDTED
jgi:hypothetical protein